MYESLPFLLKFEQVIVFILKVLRLETFCFSLNNKKAISIRIEFKDQ